MSRCAECGVYACRSGKIDNAPEHCPMLSEEAVYEDAKNEYLKPEVREIALKSALTESAGYCQVDPVGRDHQFQPPGRLHHSGTGFLRRPAQGGGRSRQDPERRRIQVESVMCKTGSVPKETLGVKEDEKVRPGQFEPMCNPICQAKLLNRAGTQLNILLGLCVGHDTLFLKYSEAPATIFAVKDRALAHNPLGAIYAGHYFSRKFADWKK